MLLIYGEAGKNGRLARELYAEQYPKRRIPSERIFARIEQRLRETGKLSANRSDTGGMRHVRTPNFEEKVLTRFKDDPDASIRGVARTLGVSRSAVRNVLSEQ